MTRGSIAGGGNAPESSEANSVAARVKAAGERALAEAEARRAKAGAAVQPVEVAGREGPEPVRYGDWEVNGVASDF